jgi:hypothetical protein
MRGAAVMFGLAPWPCIVCSDARDCDWEGNCLETVLDEVWIWYSGHPGSVMCAMRVHD